MCLDSPLILCGQPNMVSHSGQDLLFDIISFWNICMPKGLKKVGKWADIFEFRALQEWYSG